MDCVEVLGDGAGTEDRVGTRVISLCWWKRYGRLFPRARRLGRRRVFHALWVGNFERRGFDSWVEQVTVLGDVLRSNAHN